MVYTIKSTRDFDDKIRNAGSKVVLVDFFANWCGPCKMMESTVNALEKKYANEAVVMKVNVDKFEKIADYYKVYSLPTFMFFRNGKRITGFSGADDLKLKHKMAQLC